MFKRFFIFFCCLFSLIDLSYSQFSIGRQNQFDNFSIYLFGVQSELLGDLSSAKVLYESSLKQPDSTYYLPSLLKSLNFRFLTNDFSYSTEKLLKTAYSFKEVDRFLLDDMSIKLNIGQGKISKAKDMCLNILKTDSLNARILLSLADIYNVSELKDSALFVINKYEKYYGFDLRLYTIKRDLLSSLDLNDSLLCYVQRVYESYPDNFSILGDLATVYSSVGQDSLSLSIWKDIEQKDPDNIELLLNRCLVYSYHNMKIETINSIGKLFASGRLKPDAREHFLQLLFMTVDVSKDSTLLPSLDSMFLSISSLESDTVTFIRRSSVDYFNYRKLFNYSLPILNTLIHTDSTNVDYYLLRSSILYQTGNTDEAYFVLDSTITIFPHNPSPVLFKASLLNENLGFSKCKSFLLKSIKSETVDTIISHYYSYLADLLHDNGSTKQSFSAYDKAISYNPNNVLALNNYAYFLALSGIQLDKALGMSHKCNMLVSMSATYLDTEAYILYRMGQYQSAKDLMDKAFSTDTQNFSDEIYLHYADILAALNNKILAREYYNRALNAGADPTLIENRIKNLK